MISKFLDYSSDSNNEEDLEEGCKTNVRNSP